MDEATAQSIPWPAVSAALSLVSITVGIIALRVSRRSSRFSRLVADAQGVFLKAHISFQVFGVPVAVPLGDPVTGMFLIACHLSKERILSFPFPFVVENTGDKSAIDVQLMFRCNQALRFGGTATASVVGPGQVRVDMVQNGEMVTTVLNVPAIHPKQAFSMEDQITIPRDSLIDYKVPVVTADKVKLVVSGSVFLSYRMDFAISHKDAQPISGSISIAVIDVSRDSAKNVLSRLNGATKEQGKRRWFQRVMNLFRGSDTRIRKVEYISYEPASVTHREGLPLDDVPLEALQRRSGFRTDEGAIYIPGVIST